MRDHKAWSERFTYIHFPLVVVVDKKCHTYVSVHLFEVNIQDFLQVFQSSGIGEVEDNLTTSADPLSYATNGPGVQEKSLIILKSTLLHTKIISS